MDCGLSSRGSVLSVWPCPRPRAHCSQFPPGGRPAPVARPSSITICTRPAYRAITSGFSIRTTSRRMVRPPSRPTLTFCRTASTPIVRAASHRQSSRAARCAAMRALHAMRFACIAVAPRASRLAHSAPFPSACGSLDTGGACSHARRDGLVARLGRMDWRAHAHHLPRRHSCEQCNAPTFDATCRRWHQRFATATGHSLALVPVATRRNAYQPEATSSASHSR